MDIMPLIRATDTSRSVNIEMIRIFRVLAVNDIYVDTISLGSREPTADVDGESSRGWTQIVADVAKTLVLCLGFVLASILCLRLQTKSFI